MIFDEIIEWIYYLFFGIFNWFSLVLGGCITIIIAYLGGLDKMLEFLIIAMILDFVTGLLKGVIHKNLSSKKSYNGIVRKIVMLMIIGFGAGLDQVLKLQGQMLNIRTMLLIFYLGSEGISLLENAEQLGVPIPSRLKEILVQCKKKAEVKKE